MKKFLILLLSSIVISAIIFAFTFSHAEPQLDMATRQQYINYLNARVMTSHYKSTKAQLRELLEDELDFHDYSYIEGVYKVAGYADMYDRVIKINETLSVEAYCTTLCHEMCHLKYNDINETRTQFRVFKHLYESDNEELKRAGTWFGIYILNGDYDGEYDCSYMIVDYLVDSVSL